MGTQLLSFAVMLSMAVMTSGSFLLQFGGAE
jgi:hypothetical protein